MKREAGTPIYPDANSTLRLTYGRVLPYRPADGVEYGYYTTLKGAMEKEDPQQLGVCGSRQIKAIVPGQRLRTIRHARW